MMSLLKNDIKQLREVIILFSGMLGINVVLALLSVKKEIVITLFFLIIMLLVLIIPLLNLNYLHDKTKATHMLSLPWTKQNLFITKYSSGLVAIMIPIVGYYLISFALGTLIIPVVPIILLILIYYSIGCLVGQITGTTTMHGFIYISIALLPLLIYTCLLSLLTTFVLGIEQLYFTESLISYFVPFLKLFNECFTNTISVPISIFYCIYIIALLVLGILSSQYRKIENTGKGLVFPILDTIVKSVIILCFSWIVTSIVITNSSTNHIYIIYITTTLLLSLVLQLEKVRKINYRFVLIQTIIISSFTTIVFILSSQYLQNNIPKNIESVQILSRYDDHQTYKMNPVTKSSGITKVKEIHQYLIKETNKESTDYTITIKYQLSGGDIMYRDYFVSEQQYVDINHQIANTESLYQSYYSKYYYLLEEIRDASWISIHSMDLTEDNDLQEDIRLSIDKPEDLVVFKNIFEEEIKDDRIKEIRRSEKKYQLNLFIKNQNKAIIVFEDGPLLNAIERYILLKK